MNIPEASTVEGWMSVECMDWLASMGAMSSSMVEVGCWRGRSTLAILSRSKGRLWAVDTWRGTLDDPEQNAYFLDKEYAYQDFRHNLEYYLKNDQVVPLQMTSVVAAEVIRTAKGDRSFDFIFLDGDHRYNEALTDIESYWPLVKPNGILAGHDYGTKLWPGVRKAVNKFFHHRHHRGPGSIWLMRRPSDPTY